MPKTAVDPFVHRGELDRAVRRLTASMADRRVFILMTDKPWAPLTVRYADRATVIAAADSEVFRCGGGSLADLLVAKGATASLLTEEAVWAEACGLLETAEAFQWWPDTAQGRREFLAAAEAAGLQEPAQRLVAV